MISHTFPVQHKNAHIGDTFMNFNSNLTGRPSLSRGPEMSKHCSTDATVVKSISSAKYLPGQTLQLRLISAKRADEQATICSPSSVAEDECAGVLLANVQLPISEIPFRFKFLWIGIYERIARVGPVGQLRTKPIWISNIRTYQGFGRSTAPRGM